ncbi:DUF2971 domain-containing protein [Azospira inquinata]|uniref:DUF2971 domain-containing protein n=1 Tax=Azospira inquinata TaxID=2785627 RepID=A0A975SKR2_9RHOO|nr:DUF2971 domain-containing protein [Azospira inquinata]QWT46545.1 DUF2971 domain-containing protein [Azospira inquinata]QWT48130.1 DUF2971 domain-containing protein [Azospira inquinata]
MRVYYFTKASNAIDDIRNQHIKLSRFSEVNDVYELLSVAVDEERENVRNALLSAKEDNDKGCAFVSFSECFDNPLMWGHYADKFRGICLGFECSSDFLEQMEYKSGCPEVDWDLQMTIDRILKLRELLRRTKFVDWHYEREWRCFVSLPEECDLSQEDSMLFMKFPEGMRLCEVILGCYCEESAQYIKKTLEEIGLLPSVEIFKSKISFRDFKIQKEKVDWDALKE